MAKKATQPASKKAAQVGQSRPVPATTDSDNHPRSDGTAGSEKPILVWEAQEFLEYDRDKRWYVIAGVIGALLVVAALLLRQWLAAVVFALATYVVIQRAGDKPRTFTYGISKLGIQVNQTFIPYNELRAFWVIYKPPVKTLTFQRVSKFKPLIKVHLADVDPLAVKNVLKTYLPEETKRDEDFLDKLGRLIRL